MGSNDNNINDGHPSTNKNRVQKRGTFADRANRLRQRLGLEAKMIREFDQVVFSNTLLQLDVWQVLDQERDFAWSVFQSAGIVEGTLAFGLTFFGLNRLPRMVARRAARKQSSYQLDKFPKAPTQSPFQQPQHQWNKQQVIQSRRRFLFSAMELTFDLGMSLGMGAGVAFIRSNHKQAEQALLQVPMQPGRSLISDHLCDNLLQEYQRQWLLLNEEADSMDDDHNAAAPPSRRDILREPTHRNLKFYTQLAANCRHRIVMEEQIRGHQPTRADGEDQQSPVEIPDTGVIPMSEDPLVAWMLELEFDHVHEQHTANKNHATE
ncbi:expressed unknown protein [Seminavis robusta]|uniref:Uncharacterized protein n=1 Tax=Seminavis robusta TaxID=568900 RepID=A0A9N8EK56_9STRA|nr:expressed unknown protein [Seminavis robusta]|eukprot:Sro1131_g244660.1 n/a (321) ;mRNA; r:21464-22426